jgi:hypothetical protein
MVMPRAARYCDTPAAVRREWPPEQVRRQLACVRTVRRSQWTRSWRANTGPRHGERSWTKFSLGEDNPTTTLRGRRLQHISRRCSPGILAIATQHQGFPRPRLRIVRSAAARLALLTASSSSPIGGGWLHLDRHLSLGASAARWCAHLTDSQPASLS